MRSRERQEEKNMCKGIVTGHLGACSIVMWGDGCVRPGPARLELGTVVLSTPQLIGGVCEHTNLLIDTPIVVEEKVDEAIIEKAKRPPKLPGLQPVPQTEPPTPVQGYEFDLSLEDKAELQRALREVPEPVSAGKPISPFDEAFNPTSDAPKPTRSNKPVSPFDNPDQFRNALRR